MRDRMAPAAARWALAASLALWAGCGGGDGLERMPIDGTVTFDGKPLEEGRIQFFPDPGNAEPIMAGAPIRNGSYTIPRAEGLVPGSYVVRVSSASGEEEAMAGEGDADMPGLGPLHPVEGIPARYNTASELSAEVTSGGKNTFDFQLEK